MLKSFPRCLSIVLRMETASLNARRSFCEQQVDKIKEDNPFYSKYAKKFAALQNSSPEEFEERVIKLGEIKIQQNLSSSSNPTSTSKIETKQTHLSETKALSSIMKLELLENKTSEEIESIWKSYHKEKNGLYAVLPEDVYDKIHSKSNKYPTFLFPLPKNDGYEFILSQYSLNCFHFTPLIKYQAYKENAPVCLTLTYFPEFQKSKGIVLMRGEYDENSMKPYEAQCLTNQLQLFYGDSNAKRDKMLWHFNKEPETFKHMDLISELEYGLGK